MITKKTKIVAGGSLVFFSVCMLGVFLLWWHIQNTGQQLAVQAQEVADFEAKGQTYRDLERVIESTQEQRDALEDFVLTEAKAVDFLAKIEQLALTQGVELTTNSLEVTQGKDLFDSLLISYSVAGTKERVEALFLLLEALPYHTEVSRLSLQYSDDGYAAAAGSVEITVSLLQYDR